MRIAFYGAEEKLTSIETIYICSLQKSSKLGFFYQIVKIQEFLKYARRSRASKALPLDDLSGAVSAYYQRRTEPVVLDTLKNVEILIQRLSLGL